MLILHILVIFISSSKIKFFWFSDIFPPYPTVEFTLGIYLNSNRLYVSLTNQGIWGSNQVKETRSGIIYSFSRYASICVHTFSQSYSVFSTTRKGICSCSIILISTCLRIAKISITPSYPIIVCCFPNVEFSQSMPTG